MITDRNLQQANGSSAVTSNDKPYQSTEPVKKESRLKHFFAPMRKRAPIPVVPPVPPGPPITSQPDLFISNILPSNMYVNPLILQSNVPESSMKPQAMEATSSPTSSFQV